MLKRMIVIFVLAAMVLGVTAVMMPAMAQEEAVDGAAEMVLEEFAVSSVTIEIEKFILPNTRCVGVMITRTAKGKASGDAGAQE